MKRIMCLLLMVISFQTQSMPPSEACAKWNVWTRPACKRLYAIINEGNNDLYLTGYAWHNRYTYSPAKVRTFNERAFGGGFGKGMYDEYGNWQGLYLIAFMDSHNHVEPMGGYSWQKIFRPTEHLKIGAGFTVFLTSRVDINESFPFPGALPVLTLGYKNITLNTIYIPGARGAGNVLFLIGRYTFVA